MSVRNTLNGLLWIGGLALYLVAQRPPPWRARAQPASSSRRAARRAAHRGVPDLERHVLSAKRIERQRLLPVRRPRRGLFAIYSVGATVYVPHLFSSYATRYGMIGAVFAMISALFCVMLVLVGSAAAGRRSTTSSTASGGASGPPTTRSGASGTSSPPQARARWRRCAPAGSPRTARGPTPRRCRTDVGSFGRYAPRLPNPPRVPRRRAGLYGAIVGLAVVVALEEHPPAAGVVAVTLVGSSAIAVALADSTASSWARRSRRTTA